MSFPKVNISYVNPEAVMIDRMTGKLTPEGKLLARAINALIDRHGGVTGAAIPIPDYLVTTLPSASAHAHGVIVVTNETGGEVLAESDGVNWRRQTDRAIVS